MTQKLLAVMFFLFLLFFTIVGTTSAQTQVGVSKGNEIKYTVTFLWNSTNPNEPIPSYLLEENQTEYYQATISSVTDTLVGIQTTWHFQNGTDIKNDEQVDVSTGNGGSMLVYGTNLKAGDSLYALASYPWIVNETEDRAYPAGIRATNHITENRTDLGTDYVYSYVSLYFDQKTGLLVQAYFEDVYSATPDQTFARLVTIQESNVWAVPEFPSTLILPLLMIVLLAAVIVYRKKHVNVKQRIIP